MLTTTTTEVALTGLRHGERPATWGQEQMWSFLRWLEPDTQRHNQIGMAAVPPGRSTADVVAGVATLVRRHESLRTRYRLGPGGHLVQCLAEAETVLVEVRRAGRDEVAELTGRIQADLAGTRFDVTRDLPVRFVVAEVEGVAQAVAFTVSHIAADMSSARLLQAQLAGLLASATGPSEPHEPPEHPEPPVPQPFDRADFERSAAGEQASARAADRWRRAYEAMPRTLATWEPGPPAPGPRFRSGHLRSRALGPALRILARRHRVSSTVVALAATAAVLGRHAGAQACGLGLIASNRFDPALEGIVTSLTQIVGAPVDLTGTTVEDVVRAARLASFRAYQQGPYDARAIEALRAQVGHQRGVELDLSSLFNDVREPVEGGDSPDRPIADVRSAGSESRFHWDDGVDRENVRIFVVLADDPEPGWTRLGLMSVDTAFYPADTARRLVEAVEAVLIGALEESSLDRLLDRAGVTAAKRDDEWLRVEGAWVHLPAVEDLVRQAVSSLVRGDRDQNEDQDGDQIPVRVTADGPGRLVAHVVTPSPDLTPEALHAACLRVLRTDPGSGPEGELRTALGDAMAPRWPTAMAPHEYVLAGGRSGPGR